VGGNKHTLLHIRGSEEEKQDKKDRKGGRKEESKKGRKGVRNKERMEGRKKEMYKSKTKE
jgi:hypothetical protein